MVARTMTGRSSRRLVTSTLLLGGLFAGGVLLAPDVAAAPAPGAVVASGVDHADDSPRRRANESGTIGDIRTVISAEAHRCDKDCKHDFY
jgi:hypothetical protein